MELTDAAVDEAFLLDLLNSTPIVDGVQQDELDTAEAGRSWLRARGQTGSTNEWKAARTARTTLQAVVRGQQRASSLAPLLDQVSYRPSVSDDELRRTRPGRLRPCENPECALFLIDHSKPNKARWCSMAVCGNRMKARRHYERTRNNPE